MISEDEKVLFRYTVPKFASIASDFLICIVVLAPYLIVGLVLFLVSTINLGSFLLLFVGISVLTAVICAVALFRQGKTEYLVYKKSRIVIWSRNKLYDLPFWNIEEIKLTHSHRNKSKGTIEFIPYEKYRRRGVRFCFKNLPDVDDVYESLKKSYLYCNSSSLTVSEWLDISFEGFDDGAAAFCFGLIERENGQFNYEIYAEYITTDYRELAEDAEDEILPETVGWEEWFNLTQYEFYSFSLNMFSHPFKAQNDDEAYKYLKEELLKYIESGQYSQCLKNCNAIVISTKSKFEQIY